MYNYLDMYIIALKHIVLISLFILVRASGAVKRQNLRRRDYS